MSGLQDGVRIPAPIIPNTVDDTYPTHDSLYGIGGRKEVSTMTERDAIPASRLRVGSTVYVAETDLTYRVATVDYDSGEVTWVDDSVPLVTQVTTAQLQQLIDDSDLKPGSNYELTDYDGTMYVVGTKRLNTANHSLVKLSPILTALSENTLSEEAKVKEYPSAKIWFKFGTDSRFDYSDLGIPNNYIIYRTQITSNENLVIQDVPYDIWNTWVGLGYMMIKTVPYHTNYFDYNRYYRSQGTKEMIVYPSINNISIDSGIVSASDPRDSVKYFRITNYYYELDNPSLDINYYDLGFRIIILPSAYFSDYNLSRYVYSSVGGTFINCLKITIFTGTFNLSTQSFDSSSSFHYNNYLVFRNCYDVSILSSRSFVNVNDFVSFNDINRCCFNLSRLNCMIINTVSNSIINTRSSANLSVKPINLYNIERCFIFSLSELKVNINDSKDVVIILPRTVNNNFDDELYNSISNSQSVLILKDTKDLNLKIDTCWDIKVTNSEDSTIILGSRSIELYNSSGTIENSKKHYLYNLRTVLVNDVYTGDLPDQDDQTCYLFNLNGSVGQDSSNSGNFIEHSDANLPYEVLYYNAKINAPDIGTLTNNTTVYIGDKYSLGIFGISDSGGGSFRLQCPVFVNGISMNTSFNINSGGKYLMSKYRIASNYRGGGTYSNALSVIKLGSTEYNYGLVGSQIALATATELSINSLDMFDNVISSNTVVKCAFYNNTTLLGTLESSNSVDENNGYKLTFTLTDAVKTANQLYVYTEEDTDITVNRSTLIRYYFKFS